MAAMTNVVISFAVLVVIYLAATIFLTLLAWLRKHRTMPAEKRRALLDRIDESTDKLKEQLFFVAVILAFFVIAPLMVLMLIFRG
jgi:hypothetical protein